MLGVTYDSKDKSVSPSSLTKKIKILNNEEMFVLFVYYDVKFKRHNTWDPSHFLTLASTFYHVYNNHINILQ